MKLNWGKPRIFVRKCSNLVSNPNPFIEFPTPVQSSTTLETTKGDKVEAKVEGGENEDVRYNRNTYQLTLRIRTLKDRLKPLVDEDGIITDEYELYIQPEDTTAPGMFMSRSTVSEADQFNADDGGAWEYTFDALKNKTAGKGQIQWGYVTVTGTAEAGTLSVAFSPVENLTLSLTSLLFSKDIDEDGIVIACSESGASVTKPDAATWVTATVSGTSITITVAENSGAERTAVLTVSKDGKTGYITVTQQKGN